MKSKDLTCSGLVKNVFTFPSNVTAFVPWFRDNYRALQAVCHWTTFTSTFSLIPVKPVDMFISCACSIGPSLPTWPWFPLHAPALSSASSPHLSALRNPQHAEVWPPLRVKVPLFSDENNISLHIRHVCHSLFIMLKSIIGSCCMRLSIDPAVIRFTEVRATGSNLFVLRCLALISGQRLTRSSPEEGRKETSGLFNSLCPQKKTDSMSALSTILLYHLLYPITSRLWR